MDATEQVPVSPKRMQYQPAKTPEEATAPGEKTVTMIFPKPVMVMTNDYLRVCFDQGPQEVPEHLVGHPYLKSNGVKKYEPRKGKK